MRIRSIIAGLALMLIALSATAIERWFPANAKRGSATFTTYPKIVIDGKVYQPAPGLRIWNKMNIIQFQTATKGENVAINYTIDPYKLVDRIWILSPAEAAKSLSSNQPQGNPPITVTTPSTTTTTSTSQTATGQ